MRHIDIPFLLGLMFVTASTEEPIRSRGGELGIPSGRERENEREGGRGEEEGSTRRCVRSLARFKKLEAAVAATDEMFACIIGRTSGREDERRKRMSRHGTYYYYYYYYHLGVSTWMVDRRWGNGSQRAAPCTSAAPRSIPFRRGPKETKRGPGICLHLHRRRRRRHMTRFCSCCRAVAVRYVRGTCESAASKVQGPCICSVVWRTSTYPGIPVLIIYPSSSSSSSSSSFPSVCQVWGWGGGKGSVCGGMGFICPERKDMGYGQMQGLVCIICHVEELGIGLWRRWV
ncbi:hypothetical protein LY76DRAFT_322206 [Colletotrichum caudatum]|nr:hypothetical protein LY76DRAFT_322206 [Colletotrichum caudatum]